MRFIRALKNPDRLLTNFTENAKMIEQLVSSDDIQKDGVIRKMDKKLIYFVNNNLCTKYGINFNYSTMTESFNLHLHDFYELEIVTRGGCVECLNGDSFEISEGDVYILTPSDIHNFILPEKGGHVEIFNVSFYKEYVTYHIRECLDKITTALVPKIEPEQYQLIYQLAKRAKEGILSENASNRAAAEHMLSCILCMLLGMRNTVGIKTSNEKSRVSLILDYISNNYCNDISLSDTADKFQISKCYLSTLLTTNLGKGFREVLNIYRMRQVTNELLLTEKSITDICYDAGYQNYVHFSRLFKQQFGMTPSQYRTQVDGIVKM